MKNLCSRIVCGVGVWLIGTTAIGSVIAFLWFLLKVVGIPPEYLFMGLCALPFALLFAAGSPSSMPKWVWIFCRRGEEE